MNKVYITSYGAIPVGKYPMHSETDLAMEVIAEALRKLNLTQNQVEGLFTTMNFNNYMDLQGSIVCEALRIAPKVMACLNCGGMAGGAAIRAAYNEIVLGKIQCAVVYAAEREFSLLGRIGEIATKKGEGCPVYDPLFQPFGTISVIWNYACSARRYMHEFSATENDFAQAMVRDSKNAMDNPLAAFNKKQLTLDEIMKSEVLSSPIKQLDACTIRDGAAALVIMNEKLAKKYAESPIQIRGIGEFHDNSNFIPTDQFTSITSFIALKRAVREALSMSNITLKDIDVAELYAPFSPHELMIPEDIGWFAPGEMIKRITDGSTNRDGEIPINTLGGVLGRGHPAFVTPLYETIDLYRQLQGKAGAAQVVDAKIGLMQCEGGMLNNVFTMILDQEG